MFEQVVNAMELTGRPRKIVFKIERYFDRYLNPLIRVVMKGVGIVLVIVACFLLLSITFFWFYAIVPMITSEYSFFRFFNILLGIYISFCLFFNYILTISSDPGTPPKEWLDKMDQLEQQQKKNNNKNNNNNNIDNIDNELNENNNISTSTSSSVIIDIEKNKIVNDDDDDDEDDDRNRDPKKGEGFSSWCKKCNQHKPPRTHHCHICNRCICRMDHHCPWMNNCVGYRNHRYFILFLFYLLVGSFYIVSIFGLILGDYIGYNKSIYYTYYPVMFFIGILALSMLIAMGGFFGWHLYLIITNQTTIEFQYNRLLMATNNKQGELSYNEYDVGPTKNLEMLFGSSKWYWILLPSLRPLPYDGTYFPSMKTVGSSKDYHYSNRIV